jgi:uncharacterized membrane protein
MNDWLSVVVVNVVLIIQAMALVVVAYGTLEAFVAIIRAIFSPSPGRDFHSGYVRYARWLIAALTFQLAADIVQTTFAPSWDELGRLAAIAAIRAFINFFLEHDLAQQEKARRLAEMPPSAPASGTRSVDSRSP